MMVFRLNYSSRRIVRNPLRGRYNAGMDENPYKGTDKARRWPRVVAIFLLAATVTTTTMLYLQTGTTLAGAALLVSGFLLGALVVRDLPSDA